MEHCTMLASAAAQQGQRRGSNVRRIEQDVKHIQPARARSWLFSPATLDRSPSRIDGLSEAEERRQRRSGCAHIQAIIRGVLEEPLRHAKLSDPTLASEAALESKMRAPAATAMVLFNRFYARHSFARHDRFLVAITCAFVGFKIEEMHQKIRHVINAGWDSWYAIGGGAGTGGPYATGTGPGTIGGGPPLHALAGSGTPAPVQPLAKPRPDAQGAEFNALRNAVLDTERILLYTLEFDLAVETPIPLVKELLLLLKESNAFSPLGWTKTARNRDAPAEVIQGNSQAQNIAFTMCCSDLCLRFTPLELACAALEIGFGLACSPRSVTSPITWQALRRVVTQAQYTADLVSKMGPAGSSLAAGGSGTPGGSGSSAGASAVGSGPMGVGAGGASVSLAQAVRPLEEPIVREVLTRYEQYFTESIDDSAALLGNPHSDLRPAASVALGGVLPGLAPTTGGWVLASTVNTVGTASARQGVALSSFRSSYTPSPYTPGGALSTPSEAAGSMSNL